MWSHQKQKLKCIQSFLIHSSQCHELERFQRVKVKLQRVCYKNQNSNTLRETCNYLERI